MSLREYRRKRRFEVTPEPPAAMASGVGPLRFCVQRHHATRLHYDFRLELNGALKSWAVPKGPSLNPDDKRLAVMVEDHPLDYRTFEGTIPKGNYGAGTVMVWDEGVYHHRQTIDRAESERLLAKGLEEGQITFMLYGMKLKGEFALIKLQRGEPNAWLLVKKRDQFATDHDVLQQDRSALTGRSIEEIAAGMPPLRKPKPDLKGAPNVPMPRNVKPMFAEAVEKPFDKKGWLYEIKWDGYRAIAQLEGERVRLYSRRNLAYGSEYGSVAQYLHAIEHDAVLDGELVVVDDQGRPRFGLLQNYGNEQAGQLVYYVFDILHLDGHDLQKLPLKRRKEILSEVIGYLPNVKVSEHVEEHGMTFFDAVVAKGLEGVMAKDGNSPYRQGIRSTSWLKIKGQQRDEAVIAGFTKPQGSREGFGSLILGQYRDGILTYVGHVGTGFDTKTLHDLRAKLEPLRIDKCPFAVRPETNAPATWVKPELVCEVSFQEWSHDGHVRHPVYVGLRSDKRAKDVQPEKHAPPPKPTAVQVTAPKPGQVTINGHVVALTNLNKIYWPEDGYRKGDLINYYRGIAPVILPYLRDRPESLNRHPNGIHGKNFFHKDAGDQAPPWVKTVRMPSDGGDKREINYLVIQDEATLAYVANLGCIELNPWASRLQHIDQPDFVVIDLDPEVVAFDVLVKVAQTVRKLLDKTDAPCHAKTSGKRGLHVYVPLGARYDYEQAKTFAELVARLVNAQLPDTTSVIRNPAERQQRVYLDFLQNGKGKTLAAPYSVRPVVGARVSAPLKWTEVKKGLDPAKFTIKTMPARLDKVGDLWKPVLDTAIDLKHSLERLAAHVRRMT